MTETPETIEKPKKSRRRRKRKDDQLLRIEELEQLLAQFGGQVDPQTLVSMYMPHRKRGGACTY